MRMWRLFLEGCDASVVGRLWEVMRVGGRSEKVEGLCIAAANLVSHARKAGVSEGQRVSRQVTIYVKLSRPLRSLVTHGVPESVLGYCL